MLFLMSILTLSAEYWIPASIDAMISVIGGDLDVWQNLDLC
jgi:hypothetical protein